MKETAHGIAHALRISPDRIRDPSLWGVVAGNILSIVMAAVQKWDLGEVLWIYWVQSVIIGLINFYRILSLRDFSVEGVKMNNRPVAETPATRRSIAFFFLFHYGFFHVVYAAFLGAQAPLGGLDMDDGGLFLILMCAAGFAGAHGFSFAHNLRRDFRDSRPNIGTVMAYPYLRILPMHITIIAGAAFSALTGGTFLTLLLFMALKTVSDALMHVAEHALFQKGGDIR